MLVLSRKPSERILIGEDIVITVISIRGDKVRIGIDAPRHISVHREEIGRRILEQGYRPAAEAACDVRGLGGAGYEMDLYHKQQPPQDDQVLQDKLRDEGEEKETCKPR